MKYYIKALRNYATFSGRARRKEYWMFFLFNVIAFFIKSFVEILTGETNPGEGGVSKLYYFVMFIPSLAIAVRKVHDLGKSGFCIMIPI